MHILKKSYIIFQKSALKIVFLKRPYIKLGSYIILSELRGRPLFNAIEHDLID